MWTMRKACDAEPLLRRFEAFYEDCYQAIYAYAYRRMPSAADDVPDVVAEVFAIAWRRITELPDPPEDRLWLYGVARRVVLDYRRRAVRKSLLEALLKSAASTGQPGAVLGDRDLRVWAAVERLRPADREALRLVALDGLSHAEAAQVLGCSVNAVALRIHKAKARLKAELAPSSDHHQASQSACAASPEF
jgi:RNA polymerase sigma-70 factor (ECF subfamily)